MEQFKLRWNTWAVCSTTKIIKDISDNNIKRMLGEEMVKKEMKVVVEDCFSDMNNE